MSLNWVSDDNAPAREVTRSAPGRLHEVFHDSKVQVVSDANVSAAQAKALALRVEKAYAHDTAALKWADKAPLAKSLTVAVLSPNAFTRFTGDSSGSIAGVTTGPNLFVVPTRVLGRPSVEDNNTLAHELTHVEDFRETGRAVGKIPTYVMEGRAYLLGDGYANRDTAHNRDVARTLGAISGAQADAVLTRFTGTNAENQDPRIVYLGEITGGLFVEFLRTRLGGHGKADAMKRLSKVNELVGDGASYEAAFQQQFGTSLSQARAQFKQYVTNTEGRPSERLRGTLYAKSV